jgi:hypothetical protein
LSRVILTQKGPHKPFRAEVKTAKKNLEIPVRKNPIKKPPYPIIRLGRLETQKQLRAVNFS